MRGLKKFYNLTKYASYVSIKPQLLDGERLRWDFSGCWSWNNYVSFTSRNIRVKVSYDSLINLFGGLVYEVEILTGLYSGIIVYKDGWVHDVPNEMKEAVYKVIDRIKEINMFYKKSKVVASYYNQKKAEKRRQEFIKVKQHEEEKVKLMDIFK